MNLAEDKVENIFSIHPVICRDLTWSDEDLGSALTVSVAAIVFDKEGMAFTYIGF